MSKPAIPKGTRDFLPSQMRRRQYIMDILRASFELFGYVAIETPALENLTTLLGKYGDEGDRLLFKILNNGDYLAKANDQALADKNSNALTSSISKRGLRYDLTVPLARYVAMHRNDLSFPFKRYQMQPVWRADRPQKGRYQEFYQCDIDVLGSQSLMYEAEMIQMIDLVFGKLNLNVIIRYNHRKLLEAVYRALSLPIELTTFTVILDKIDKIGHDGIRKQLAEKSCTNASIDRLIEWISLPAIQDLLSALPDSDELLIAKKDIEQVTSYLSNSPLKNEVKFDLSLARGLDYYTGYIFEVSAKDIPFGSICGGGRYDDLTAVFGLKDVSGIGVSFGAERIYDVMESLNLFPDHTDEHLDLLIITMDETAHEYGYKLMMKGRKDGKRIDLYPEPTSMKKQMKYADAIGVRKIAIIGDQELKNNTVVLKDMTSGDQKEISIDELMSTL